MSRLRPLQPCRARGTDFENCRLLERKLSTCTRRIAFPRRDHYMASGRHCRESYYNALFAVAGTVLEAAEDYLALKSMVKSCKFGPKFIHLHFQNLYTSNFQGTLRVGS